MTDSREHSGRMGWKDYVLGGLMGALVLIAGSAWGYIRDDAQSRGRSEATLSEILDREKSLESRLDQSDHRDWDALTNSLKAEDIANGALAKVETVHDTTNSLAIMLQGLRDKFDQMASAYGWKPPRVR